MRKQTTIKIDIDGVLRDIIPAMCSVYAKETGIVYEPKDIVEYDVNIMFDKVENPRKFFFEDHAKELFLDSNICPGASTAMHLLKSYGFRTVVCTWQPLLSNKRYALDWLDEHHIKYDDIVFTDDKSLFPCDIIVDDNPKFLLAEPDTVRRVVIDAAYNTNVADDDIERASSLLDFVGNVCMYSAN